MTTALELDGGMLQIDDRGPRPGDGTLVFLHYWGGSSATWRKVIARLEGDVRCVAINQRGWGGSVASDGRYTLAAMADDVLAVVQHLGLTRVVLVGHSMGGKVAQLVAKAKPPQLAGLVLVAPAPPTPAPVSDAERRQMLQSYQSAAGVEQALQVLAGPSLPSEDRPGVIRDTLAGAPDAKREWPEHGMTADLGVAAGDIAVPTVLLVGSLDRVEPAARLRPIFAAVAPHARLDELAGVGHLSPLEAPNANAAACGEMIGAAADSTRPTRP